MLRFEGGKVTDGGKGRPSFAANSSGGAASEGLQSGIGEYLQSVKEGKRWPGRKRLTVKEAAITHAQLFNELTRAVSR